MDRLLLMKSIYNVKYCHAIRLKFGDTFLTSLTKFALKPESAL